VNQPEWEAITSWAPIVGRWTIQTGTPTYEGPQQDTPHPFGICVSNASFSEGTIKVLINLSEDTEGRVLLGYRSPDQPYWTVGLGGYGSAYVLSEYDPGVGWRARSGLGSQTNLVGGKDYEIEVKLEGQRVQLTVDTVRVLDYVLEQPMAPGQAGVFAWGKGRLKFSEMRVKKSRATIFVVMQFSEPYKQLYSEVIRPVAGEFGLEAYHVGDVFGPGMILDDIVQGTIQAKVIIAEVTAPNQNVFYELGYAHAKGKPTILLAERGKQPPFDIAGYRHLFYENTIGGKKQIEEALRKHITAIMGESARGTDGKRPYGADEGAHG
jgi:hypothetical protein